MSTALITTYSTANPNTQGMYALIKEKIKFAKSYMKKGFLIYEEMHKKFPIYEDAVSHL